jgi:hypothetical protein
MNDSAGLVPAMRSNAVPEVNSVAGVRRVGLSPKTALFATDWMQNPVSHNCNNGSKHCLGLSLVNKISTVVNSVGSGDRACRGYRGFSLGHKQGHGADNVAEPAAIFVVADDRRGLGRYGTAVAAVRHS